MRRILFIIVLCLVTPWLSNAQTLSNKERRHMNLLLHDAIRNYEMYSSVPDIMARSQFLYLFESPSTRIYCDLMDVTTEDQKIDVATYVDHLAEMETVEITVKEISKSEATYSADGWHTIVTFKKTINYIDVNNVWFSSEEYYGADYELVVDFVYNGAENKCYIVAIDGEMTPTTDRVHLPEKFVVVQKSKKRDDKLKFKDEKDSLQFNSFGQVFAKTVKDVVPVDYNVRLKKPIVKAQSDNYQLVELVPAPTRWRVKLRYAHAYDGIYEVSSPIDFYTQTSSATEMGVDVGIAFSLGKGRCQMGIYTGASLQQSNISFGIEDVNYDYTMKKYTPKESDFNTEETPEDVKRSYNNLSIQESVKYSDLVVPAYIAFDHFWGRNLAFTWNVGAKFYFNTKSEIDPFHVTGRAWMLGKSEALDLHFTNFMYPSYYSPDQSISLIGGAGFNINLFKRMILLSVKANYEYGLKYIHTSAENELYSKYSNSHIYPLIYFQSEKRDIAVRSFLDCVSYRRQAIWFEGGLIFKF